MFRDLKSGHHLIMHCVSVVFALEIPKQSMALFFYSDEGEGFMGDSLENSGKLRAESPEPLF